jgi:hypothetical protein
MDLSELIEGLSRPDAYPFPVQEVKILHTHISVVFLAGPFAYKVKKPVNLGFLDFRTLEKRHYFCEQEVHLNRRLAPMVYQGIVPIAMTSRGIQVEAKGETVEWAVKMERLPEEATLENRLREDKVAPVQVADLGRHVAHFHAAAEGNEHISSFGRLEVVAQNVRENFEQAEPLVGVTISRPVFDRLRELSENALTALGPLIEKRAKDNFPRDTHGDLHLDHVYVFPDRQPPADLVIIDCIEFNERFRFADPVADMAFLYMDFLFHGRQDLAVEFANNYFMASGDNEGRTLLSFYATYRAAVRGKVEGFEQMENEVPAAERAQVLARARAHWLLALGELEQPRQRPCLLLVGGLPGTGKSTLARGLSERANFTLIRSDVIRKELATVPGGGRHRPRVPRHGIYTLAWTQRTYAECLNRAEQLLFQGNRVLVDATFREESKRRDFLELAARLAVPAAFIVCQADPEVVQSRLIRRKGDASDADWSIYQKAIAEWQEPGHLTRPALRVLPTSGNEAETLSTGLQLLRQLSFVE